MKINISKKKGKENGRVEWHPTRYRTFVTLLLILFIASMKVAKKKKFGLNESRY